jgi:hypothetical protein
MRRGPDALIALAGVEPTIARKPVARATACNNAAQSRALPAAVEDVWAPTRSPAIDKGSSGASWVRYGCFPGGETAVSHRWLAIDAREQVVTFGPWLS